jgi:hypothetical protein
MPRRRLAPSRARFKLTSAPPRAEEQAAGSTRERPRSGPALHGRKARPAAARGRGRVAASGAPGRARAADAAQSPLTAPDSIPLSKSARAFSFKDTFA